MLARTRNLKPLYFTAAVALAAAGCTGGLSGPCLSDSECTVPGETCITPPTGGDASCGCDPTAAADSCTAEVATTVCHPDRATCETKCVSDDDCTAAGERCDTQMGACRDASKFADCTKQGNECDTTKVCDPTSKACVEPCTSTSCATGQVCNDNTRLCEADCTADGFTCPGGQVCDTTSKQCVSSCGEGTCGTTEACDPVSGQCIQKCNAATDPTVCGTGTVCNPDSGLCQNHCDAPGSGITCPTGEVCSPETHLCIEKCTGNIDCAGGNAFCAPSGLCETEKDISECNAEGTPPTTRMYVNPATNQCSATSELATCGAASGRDSGKAETAAGPTLYSAVQIGRVASVEHCTNGPEVEFYADYYDPTGGVQLTTGASGLYGSIFQAVAATDQNTSNTIVLCGTSKTDGFCAGIASTANRGRFLFKLCRPVSAGNESVAIYMKDGGGNYGNTICIAVNNQ